MGRRKGYIPPMAEAQMSAEQFRTIRRRSGLTQVQFAEQLGYNRFSISKIETGVRVVPSKLRRLVLALFGPPKVVQRRPVVGQTARKGRR